MRFVFVAPLIVVGACSTTEIVTPADKLLSDQNEKGTAILETQIDKLKEAQGRLEKYQTTEAKQEAKGEIDQMIDRTLALVETIAPVVRKNSAQQLKNWGGPPPGAPPFDAKASERFRKKSEEEHANTMLIAGLGVVGGAILTMLGLGASAKATPGLFGLLRFLPPPFNFIATAVAQPIIEAIARSRIQAEEQAQPTTPGTAAPAPSVPLEDLLGNLEEMQKQAGVHGLVKSLADKIEQKLKSTL